MSDFYANIPGSTKKVSRIVFGTATKAIMSNQGGFEELDMAFANGITAFDTARAYQKAESVLGEWMKQRNNREEIFLIGKGGHPSLFARRINEKAIRKDLETSLRLLGTDYIDLYLLHRDDERVPVAKIVELFNALIQEGKVKAYGGSNWTAKRIEAANEYAKGHGLIGMVASSPHYSLAHQIVDPFHNGLITITGKENRDQVAYYQKTQLAVMAFFSLSHGFFSGRLKASEKEKAKQVLDHIAMKSYGYEENFERLARAEKLAKKYHVTPNQIALRYIFGQKMNMFAVLSTGSEKHLKEDIEALNIPLTEEDAEYLNFEE